MNKLETIFIVTIIAIGSFLIGYGIFQIVFPEKKADKPIYEYKV